MNQGGQTYKVQRLRPTFSSPESFQNEWSYYGDSQNYGSILPHEQSFILSNNTSNFASDLSRDPSANSMDCQNSKTRLKNSTHCSQTNASDATLYDNSAASLTATDDQREGSGTQLLLLSELESDDGGEGNISCFGAVNNPFKVNAKIKYSAVGRTHVRRRHARSKSFTNSGNARSNNITMKRSSSADLLLNVRPVSDISYSDREQFLFFI